MRRPEPVPSVGELRAIGHEHGIEHLGVAPAAVLERARQRAPRPPRAPASPPGWRSPTATPTARPTRSGPSPAPGRSSSAPAPTSPTTNRRGPPGPQARVARYAWVDHYAPLRAGLRAIAHRLRASGHRAVAFADDNSIVDREVAHLAGLGWFGKNANLLLPGAGSWFVLGCVVTTAELPAGRAGRPTAAGRAGAASTPARPAPSSPPA